MSDTKAYEVDGLTFEFTPKGSPFKGLLAATLTEDDAFSADVNLSNIRSRGAWAAEASGLYGADIPRLKRALNELSTLRAEEIAAAEAKAEEEATGTPDEDEAVEDERVDELVGSPGVLGRYVEQAAEIHAVVRERPVLKLQTLVAVGAQLAPYPNGKPAGANLIITAEPGRGKNHVCDAVAALLPEAFCLPFESASAKSLFYKAESDPDILKHTWIYPNEAEAADKLVEMFRPLLSGGKAAHMTVNKDADGRNAAQELSVEGPASITIPTVRNKLDSQLQTRMLVAELPDYEGRVAGHSRASSKLLLPGYATKDYGSTVRVWRAALTSLTEVRRVVFDLDHEQFCFDSDAVSHGARLWVNLLGLMLAHAWLEQRSREVMDLPSGERAILATPEDYAVAYAIFKETCARSIINISDTHRQILDAVYELQTQTTFTDGFSQRRIAESAGLHHSTVGEHKTFLTKSAKLLRETQDGGLTLVAGAEPDWWNKGELLAGFPRPEQVKDWWKARNDSATGAESARHARHPRKESRDADTYDQKGGGRPDRRGPDAARHPENEATPEVVAGDETAVAGGMPASVNGVYNLKQTRNRQWRAWRAVSRIKEKSFAYTDTPVARAATCVIPSTYLDSRSYGVSLYEPSPIKRARRTRAELEGLDQALAVIVEEIEPATVRQIFYQAVVRGMVPKDELQGYKLVQRRLVKLRETGEVLYGWITDNVRIVHGHNRYDGPDDYARVAAEFYRRDYWADSPVNVEVWLEKDALAGSWSPWSSSNAG